MYLSDPWAYDRMVAADLVARWRREELRQGPWWQRLWRFLWPIIPPPFGHRLWHAMMRFGATGHLGFYVRDAFVAWDGPRYSVLAAAPSRAAGSCVVIYRRREATTLQEWLKSRPTYDEFLRRLEREYPEAREDVASFMAHKHYLLNIWVGPSEADGFTTVMQASVFGYGERWLVGEEERRAVIAELKPICE